LRVNQYIFCGEKELLKIDEGIFEEIPGKEGNPIWLPGKIFNLVVQRLRISNLGACNKRRFYWALIFFHISFNNCNYDKAIKELITPGFVFILRILFVTLRLQKVSRKTMWRVIRR